MQLAAIDAPRLNLHDCLAGRSYALPTTEESLAIPLSDDLIFNWSLDAEETPPSVKVEYLAWDLRQRLGAKRGFEIFLPIVEAWGDVDTAKDVWAAADRPECENDHHIVFELAALHSDDRLSGLLLPDDGEALRNEIRALADRFETLNFALIKQAFESHSASKPKGKLYDPLRRQFAVFAQDQFARDLKFGRVPMPSNSNVLTFPGAEVTPALPLTFFDECRDRAPKHWIFKGVFAKGENSSIFGAPGTLKSAFLNDAAVYAAAGKDWRGFKSKEKCGVVYFAFERADQVRRRLVAYATRDGFKDLPIAVAGNIVDMLNPGCVDIVVATIRSAEARFGIPVGFIVFDTWSKGIAAGGGDEDKARDQNIIAANLRRIHEQVSVHIAGVGHSGKDEARGERGSNARQGDVDLQIQISGDVIKTATVIKANDQPEGALTSYAGEVVALGVDEDGDPITAFILSTRALPAVPKSAKRNPRHDQAMGALHAAVAAHGVDMPAPPGLTGRPVTLDQWKDALFECGFISHDAANPRADFKRIKEALLGLKRITIRNEYVWPIGPAPSAPPLSNLPMVGRSNVAHL